MVSDTMSSDWGLTPIAIDTNDGQARLRAAADWALRARSASFLAAFASARLALTAACSSSERFCVSISGAMVDLVGLRQLDEFVVLQQVADDRRGRRFTGHGGGEHDAGHGDAVALDDAGQHVVQLRGRRVVGVVAELGDAVGQAQIGQHGSDCLHAAVDATGLDAGAHAGGCERVDERLEPSRWSSSSASIAVASSSSVAALNERSSRPSACIRFFI